MKVPVDQKMRVTRMHPTPPPNDSYYEASVTKEETVPQPQVTLVSIGWRHFLDAIRGGGALSETSMFLYIRYQPWRGDSVRDDRTRFKSTRQRHQSTIFRAFSARRTAGGGWGTGPLTLGWPGERTFKWQWASRGGV